MISLRWPWPGPGPWPDEPDFPDDPDDDLDDPICLGRYAPGRSDRGPRFGSGSNLEVSSETSNPRIKLPVATPGAGRRTLSSPSPGGVKRAFPLRKSRPPVGEG